MDLLGSNYFSAIMCRKLGLRAFLLALVICVWVMTYYNMFFGGINQEIIGIKKSHENDGGICNCGTEELKMAHVQVSPFGEKLAESPPCQSPLLSFLDSSEQIWLESKMKRDDAIQKLRAGFQREPFQLNEWKHIWDIFMPTFDCPSTTQRIGKVGDGGKWVCGFSHLIKRNSCLIYSFGVSDDISFEREFIEKSQNCVVRMYDHTVEPNSAGQADLSFQYPSRVNFYKIGLATKENSTPELKTLKTLMNTNGDNFIDILKIDVEGIEFDAMLNILDDFKSAPQLPFGQLQIELHVNHLPKEHVFSTMVELFDRLEAAGLRAFHYEANQISLMYPGSHDNFIYYYEYSFLNVKVFNHTDYFKESFKF